MVGSGVGSWGRGKGAVLGCTRGLWGPLIPAQASGQCNGWKEEGAIWSDMVGHSGTRRQKKKGNSRDFLVVQGVGVLSLVRELDSTSILVTKNSHVASNKDPGN